MGRDLLNIRRLCLSPLFKKEESEITYSSTRLSRGTLLTNKTRRARGTCLSSATNWTLVTTRPTKPFFASRTRGARGARDTL